VPEQPQVDKPDSQPVRSAAPPEPRWPAVAAFVTAWLCPASSARRTLHVRLWAACAVHLLAAFLTFVLITVLASLGERKHAFKYFQEIIEEFTSDRWQQAFLVTGGIVFSIEIAYLILAGLLMPWVAADEPLGASWKQALRFAWLHTAHALPVVLLVGFMSVCYTLAERDYRQANPYPTWTTTWTPPSLPTAPSDNSEQAWRDYQAARAEYNKKQQEALEQGQRARQEWERNKPFFVRYAPVFIFWTGIACTFWILWALLRAAGIRRPVPAIPRPPTCEFCGYNLTGTAAESRCPECGRAVIESLAPGVRAGTPWERRKELGTLRTWWRCGADAVLRPGRFGRLIKVRAQVHDHRLFLAAHLPLIFLIAWAGFLCCYLIGLGMRSDRGEEFILVALGFGPYFGYLATLLTLALAGLAANLVGLIFSVRNRRNLLPASTQVACYLGTYLTVWAACSTILVVAAFVVDSAEAFRALARHLRIAHQPLMFFFWFLPNLFWLGGYFLLVWRATAAAQHANR